MTDIEQRALELLSEVNKEMHGNPGWYEGCNRTNASPVEALCRAIEQHEAFKQEVSDALVIYSPENRNPALGRFIIAKPDPLADAVESVLSGFEGRKHAESYANQIRAALDARGLEIRSKNDD